MTMVLAFLIGVVAGLRSLTAPAVVCWAAHLGWLRLESSPLSILGSRAAAILVSVLALGELVADKLPFTPARTQLMGLSARIVTGAVSGGAVCVSAGQSLAIGAVVGAIGGVAGAFAGYKARTGLVQKLQVPDTVIALVEDAIAIGGAFLVVTRQ